mmetsp:Transcript_28436/g.64479  ORF Transcript_28436/g.64479 Transcript_28436/m.64479 type:complete len:81 (-) Transcript_28436:1557-1799(-)
MTGGRDEIKPLMPFPYLTLAHSPLSLPFSLSVSTLVEGSQWGGEPWRQGTALRESEFIRRQIDFITSRARLSCCQASVCF